MHMVRSEFLGHVQRQALGMIIIMSIIIKAVNVLMMTDINTLKAVMHRAHEPVRTDWYRESSQSFCMRRYAGV